MTKASGTSRQMFAHRHDGDHIVFWYKTAKGRARVIAEFLGSGTIGSSLMAIILPLQELEETENHLRKVGFPVDRFMEEGRLLLFASEELLPADSSDYHKIGVALFNLRKRAEEQGYQLILAGRVAPVLFERGEVDLAMMVEMAADSALGKARLLCLYDETNREGFNKGDIERIDGAHTQILHETDGGKSRTANRRKKGNPAESVKRKGR